MRTSSSTLAAMHSVFLSSGSDLKRLRDFADSLMRQILNSLLLHHGIQVRFDVDRWEDTAPQITPGKVNDLFVERALKSDVTIVLLQDELRPGTEGELKAVLESGGDRPQVCVLWFQPTQRASKKEVARIRSLLDPLSEKMLWKDSIPLTANDPDAAFLEIVRVVVDVLLPAISRSDSRYVEEVRDASTA